MYIKVNRRNRPDCIVMLCKDRTTKKWCFVNLSTEHVCTCRFNTVQEAFEDMQKRNDVISFSWIPNPYVQAESANAMTQKKVLYPALDIEAFQAQAEELDGELSNRILEDLKETT